MHGRRRLPVHGRIAQRDDRTLALLPERAVSHWSAFHFAIQSNFCSRISLADSDLRIGLHDPATNGQMRGTRMERETCCVPIDPIAGQNATYRVR